MAHGLGLGPIQFPPSYRPYTPPERRRRGAAPHARPAGPLQLKPSTVRAGAAAGQAGRGPATPGGGAPDPALTILPDDIAPVQVAFLLRTDRQRMGSSFAASAASHVVAVGLVALLLSLAPERIYEVVDINRYEGIIWLPAEGPGGGGGGGGNESLELPPQAMLEGRDETAVSVPVAEEPEVVVPDPEPEPEPERLVAQALTIPALQMAAALETRPGLLDGLRDETSTAAGSGTGGGAGTGVGGGAGPGDGDGLGPGEGGGTGGGVFRPGSGVTTPRLLRDVAPEYTSEAMRARIQGTVWLEVVVLSDGTVGDVTVTKSLDRVFGLDEQAISAARQWRFAPGTRLGEPVAVLVSLELFFNLR